ncbi:MAG TPA: phosphoribosyltransferase [Rectinemataceae bacterium]|nr:phosphoribosyltransferase [Rectinemataceae bacterium]
MDKVFPQPERPMGFEEMEGYLHALVEKLRPFEPHEVVGLARSGFPYAAWVAQLLDLPLGYLSLRGRQLALENPSAGRIAVIDDNTVSGESFTLVQRYLSEAHPHLDFRFGVLYADWFTPEDILERICYGVRLPYFPTTVAGTMKRYHLGARHRDEPKG